MVSLQYMDNLPIPEIAEKASPAVISIAISKNLPKIEGFYSMPMNGKNFVIPKFQKGKKEAVRVGGGSGFIVSENGIVLTNSHVVADAKADYTAVFGADNEKKVPMKILARDPIHDIAICKVQGEGYASVPLGDSSGLQLGEWVVAVGNALGEFSNTVSLGIVSGLSRFIQAQGEAQHNVERLRGLIQTDAAINPGNSGGPLLNMKGEVIGINTAVVFGAQNIGFSIPINRAKDDIAQIKEHGRIQIPFLGIRYLIIDEMLQAKNNLPVGYGALIMRETLGDTAVIRGSSAEKAGLREFDIILEAAGKKITPEFTLQDVLQEHTIGDEISLKVLREKKERTMKVKLEEKNQ